MTELEELAEKATQGPWRSSLTDDTLIVADLPDGQQRVAQALGDYSTDEFAEMEANAAFIAAANPQAILTLIQEKREARSKALEEAAKVADKYAIRKKIIFDGDGSESAISALEKYEAGIEIREAIRALSGDTP